MATHRPTQVPGGGILTRLLGLDPYDKARKTFEQMYAPVYPGRDNFFLIGRCGYRHPNLLKTDGQLAIDRYVRPRHPGGLHGQFSGGAMNNSNNTYHHKGNIYYDCTGHRETHQGGSKTNEGNSSGSNSNSNNNDSNSSSNDNIDPNLNNNAIAQFLRDLLTQDRLTTQQHFRHRTDQQIRELRALLLSNGNDYQYYYDLTQGNIDDLRYATDERFESLMRHLWRQDARLRRSEERLRWHCHLGEGGEQMGRRGGVLRGRGEGRGAGGDMLEVSRQRRPPPALSPSPSLRVVDSEFDYDDDHNDEYDSGTDRPQHSPRIQHHFRPPSAPVGHSRRRRLR